MRTNAIVKNCLNCNKQIEVMDDRKRFCNRSCSATYNNKIRGYKPMVDCLGGCGEKLQASKSAQYCSSWCRQFDMHGKWVRGEYTPTTQEFPSWLRDFVISRGCNQCGWREINPYTGLVPVQVDHINGNPHDHSFGNIRALCPNCHSLTGTYGNLNKGNGRKHRRNSVVV